MIMTLTTLEHLVLNVIKKEINNNELSRSNNYWSFISDINFCHNIISTIKEKLKLEIRFCDLIKYSTVNDLSNFIYNKLNSIEDKEKIEYVSDRTLSNYQKQILREFEFSDSKTANIISCFKLDGNLNLEKFNSKVHSAFKSYSLFNYVISLNDNGEYVLRTTKGKGNYEFNYLDLSDNVNFESIINSLIESKVNQQFEIERPITPELLVLKTNESTHIIVMLLSKLIIDESCINRIILDLKSDYETIPDHAVEISLLKNKSEQSDYNYETQEKYWAEIWNENLQEAKFNFKNLNNTKSSQNKLFQYSFKGIQLNEINDQLKFSIEDIILASLYIVLYKYTTIPYLAIQKNFKVNFNSDVFGLVNSLPVPIEIEEHFNIYDVLSIVEKSSREADKNKYVDIFDVLIKAGKNVYRNNDTIVSFSDNSGTQNDGSNDYDSFVVLSNTNLYFHFIYNQDALKLNLTYNESYYSLSFIEQLISHLHNTARSCINNPETLIKSVKIIDQSEINLINQFNNTSFEFPANKSVVDLIHEWVRSTPNKIAVKSDKATLTYLELDVKSNYVANRLKSTYNIDSGDVVGIYTDRSELMIVSILGILKAGATFLPLDLDYPEDRLNYIIADSKCKLILSEEDIDLSKLSLSNIYTLRRKEISQINDFDWKGLHNIQTLMYMIYTSGTTGKPKGVMIGHDSFLNFLNDIIYNKDNDLFIHPDDNISQFANLTFDVSIAEIFMALTGGAKLCIPGLDTRNDPRKFTEYLSDNKINKAVIPPSYLKLLNKESINLEILITGGEKASYEDVNYFKNKCIYINSYGPTETTVGATYLKITSDIKIEENVSIGKPISNVQIHILDKDYNPVPIGIPGEICIGGKCLSKGYLNDPELTQKCFINNPFNPSEKIYRTGDRGMWGWDGNVYFLGRQDTQVKVNGFRIELTEIENKLVQHPNVYDALVLVKENKGSKFIIAYIIYKSSIKTASNDFKNFLRSYLPEYMIPHFICPVDYFPLTKNGKIDHVSLPNPFEEFNFSSSIEKPENEIQEYLISVWEEVLQVRDININDDFFDLGGNSLKATQVLSRVNNRYNILVRLNNIFYKPTIKKLSDEIEALIWLSSSEENNNSNEQEEIFI